MANAVSLEARLSAMHAPRDEIFSEVIASSGSRPQNYNHPSRPTVSKVLAYRTSTPDSTPNMSATMTLKMMQQSYV